MERKFKSKLSSLFNFIWPLLPFVIGMISYYPFYKYETADEFPVLSAVYSSLKLYAGATEGGIHLTLWLHIARFAALYFSLSIVLKILDKSRRIFNRIKAGFKSSYVVYGKSVLVNHLCESIGRLHCIKGGDEFIDHGRNYVLMFPDDKTNLEFYAQHYSEMKDSKVYIQLENITVFSISECCARLYWRKFYPVSSEKIAVIGFGNIGQNILTFGLQMNIISPDQHFEYHIWGESGDFLKVYREIDKIAPDKLVFHGTDWVSDSELIAECDRVIICGEDTENIAILNKLMFCSDMSGAEIYLYSPSPKIVESMYNDKNIHCFGRSDEVATMDVIINQKTLEDAIKQHNFYAQKYGGEPWNKQNCFIRYSNISSADFMYVINRLYYEVKMSIEEIAELEHIRWCRYYYLNNWKYGAVRNNEQRIHNCLVPFDRLAEEEKLKDIESIKVKLGK